MTEKIRPRIYKRGWNPFLEEARHPTRNYRADAVAINMTNEIMNKGSGATAHRAATERLRELDFDPLDRLTEQLVEIEELLRLELGTTPARTSLIFNLVSAKTRILETLLPYRYGKAPVLTIESADIREPIRIILTSE